MDRKPAIPPLLLALLLPPLGLLAAPAAAAEDESDLERVVADQGARIERLEQELAASRAASNDAVARDVDGALAKTESEPASRTIADRLRLGGYLSLEYRDLEGESPYFDFHRLVLKLQADVAAGIAFDTEIEFEGGGADVDFLTDNEILVEYAELRFEILEESLSFLAGVILVPWGRFNQYHDDPLNDLTDRPLVARRIGAVAFGQPGIAVDGTVEPAAKWFLDYKVALVQGFADGFSTNGGVRDARQSFREDNNANKQLFGRFVATPPVPFVDVLEVGGSATWGRWDDDDSHEDYGVGLELFARRGPFEVVGEYMWLRIQQPGGAPVTEPERMDGWYLQVNYHFFPASWRGAHKLLTDESTFTLVLRVEEIDLNNATNGTTFRDDLLQTTLGINFRPVERMAFKLSHTWIDSDEPGSPNGLFLISWASYF